MMAAVNGQVVLLVLLAVVLALAVYLDRPRTLDPAEADRLCALLDECEAKP